MFWVGICCFFHINYLLKLVKFDYKDLIDQSFRSMSDNAFPEQRRYVQVAMDLIKQCSIRRLDEGSIEDLQQFKFRCKKPFSLQEAARLHEEFEAHFIIVKTLRRMLENETPNPSDDIQDFRTRQIRYGLRVHEAIAR